MLTPGPDHPIVIKPTSARWRARYADHVIADTDDALILEEKGHAPVVYFPKAAAAMEYMARSERITHCPYKGDASYYTLLMDGRFAENAAWSYEEPFPAMEQIRGRLAFYTDKVEVYAADEAAVNPKAHRSAVDEVVQHTDAGDGHSQREHWTPPGPAAPPL